MISAVPDYYWVYGKQKEDYKQTGGTWVATTLKKATHWTHLPRDAKGRSGEEVLYQQRRRNDIFRTLRRHDEILIDLFPYTNYYFPVG